MGNQKSRIVAAVLAFLLSTLAIDDFYVGNTTAGIVRIVILIATVILAAGTAIFAFDYHYPEREVMLGIAAGIAVLGGLTLGIWGLINVIKYLLMSDERFQEIVSRN